MWPDVPKPIPTRSRVNVLRTIKQAENICGEDKPWMTPNEYKLVLKYLMPEYDMLEWGAGKSSCVWSVFVKSLTSIEHNTKWATTVMEDLQANQDVLPVPRNKPYTNYRIRKKPSPANAYDNYIHLSELSGKKFDAILVDGRARPQCAFEALFMLKSINSVVFMHDYYSNIPDRRYYHVIEKWYDVVVSVPGSPGMVVLRPKKLSPNVQKEEFPTWWFENYNEEGIPILIGNSQA